MAAKPNETRKQELLAAIEGKRLKIQSGTYGLTDTVQQLPEQAQKVANDVAGRAKNVSHQFTSQLPMTSSPSSTLLRTVKKTGKLGSSIAKQYRARMGQERNEREVLPSTLRAKSSALIGKIELPKELPQKKVLLGAGALILLGAVAGKRKKRKKEKHLLAEVKEQKQVAKFGLGVIVLKWLLSASQPAVKHLVTNKVKKSFLG